MVKLEEIAADLAPGVLAPAGPLPAAALGLKADTDEYRHALETIKRQVEAHLNALGTSSPLAKLALIRYYSAQAALARAKTGSVKDPSGAAMSLSGSDLSHWQNMMEQARAEVERYAPSRGTSGVYFASIELKGNS